MPKILPKCKDGFFLVKNKCSCAKTIKKKTIKKRTKKKTLKKKHYKRLPRKLKRKLILKDKTQSKMSSQKTYNDEFLHIINTIIDIKKALGEKWVSIRATTKAKDALLNYTKNITSVDQLKNIHFIGENTKTYKRLKEFVDTGKVAFIEEYKKHPALVFKNIYGIGPKKIKDLLHQNITTVEDLSKNVHNNTIVLNKNQLLGLQYYNDLLERIPRKEIIVYKAKLQKIFKQIKTPGGQFQIVGSFRRGLPNSGDIDIIITDTNNDHSIFDTFLDALKKENIIIEFLTRGKKKSLTIGTLPYKYARRLDFMYSTPQEYALALLYFTGSAGFNTVMRQRALDLGFTMNEHELCKMVDKKKGPKVDIYFKDEQAIFDFLGLMYKEPEERISGKDVIIKDNTVLGKKQPKKKKKIKQKVKSTVTSKKRLLLLKENGIDALESLSEKELANMLLTANDYYYNKKPLIDDGVYDILKTFIENQYPNCDALEQTGAPIKTKKVNLPYFLGSMEKIKPDTKALDKFKKTYKGQYVISAKLDGISALYTTEGDEPKLYTRGNGSVGKDISHLIPHLDLPDIKNIVMRGELILPKKIFNTKYKVMGYKNGRAFITGAVGQEKREPSKWKDIRFVAYELIKPTTTPSKQMKWLVINYKYVVKHMVKKKITNEFLSTLLLDWRDNYEYNVDGVIVVNNKIYPRTNDKYPKYAFAFKMVLSDQMAESLVTDVIWTPSKDGLLKPRVQYEPVVIGDATLEFATAHNADFIRKNKIGIGAVIQIIKSGDVIPKIQKVITPAETAKMPTIPYKWNKTHKDAIMINPQKNSIVREKNITKFFQDLEIERLGPGNIKRIIEAGYDTVPQILKMKTDDFMEVEGFQEKLSKTVRKNIRVGVKKASLPTLMKATNLLGRGMGSRRIIMILDEYPTVLTSSESPETKIAKILQIKGFAKKTAELFVSRIPNFLAFLSSTKLQYKLKEVQKQKDTSHPLYNKSIVMTGFRNKELTEKILKATGKALSTSVSSNTFVVLVKDTNENTSKANKARDKGVSLMTPETFVSTYFK